MNNPRSAESQVLASIITVNTNEWHRLQKYFPSILETRGDYEIIISDNGSTDGSTEAIGNLYKDVVIVENGSDLGFAEANNRGASVARGEFLVFINPDTTVDPSWLVNLLEPFCDAAVGLVAPKILLMECDDRINACGNVLHTSGIAQCRGINEARMEYGSREEVDAVSGAAFAIRRALFEELGGFDKDFFLYVEETDLSVRARMAGWKCVYQPSSIVFHDYHLRFGPQKVYFQERNRYMLILKNYRWASIVALLPTLLLAEVVTWGFAILRGGHNMRNKINAYRWIISERHVISEKRKKIQSMRRVKDRDILAKTAFKLNFRQVTGRFLSGLSEAIFNTGFGLLKLMELAIIWW